MAASSALKKEKLFVLTEFSPTHFAVFKAKPLTLRKGNEGESGRFGPIFRSGFSHVRFQINPNVVDRIGVFQSGNVEHVTPLVYFHGLILIVFRLDFLETTVGVKNIPSPE